MFFFSLICGYCLLVILLLCFVVVIYVIGFLYFTFQFHLIVISYANVAGIKGDAFLINILVD